MTDAVTLSQATADALSALGLGDFHRVETPERMAWVLWVLRGIEDSAKVFPRGKWATLQEIERQVADAAQAAAITINEGREP